MICLKLALWHKSSMRTKKKKPDLLVHSRLAEYNLGVGMLCRHLPRSHLHAAEGGRTWISAGTETYTRGPFSPFAFFHIFLP